MSDSLAGAVLMKTVIGAPEVRRGNWIAGCIAVRRTSCDRWRPGTRQAVSSIRAVFSAAFLGALVLLLQAVPAEAAELVVSTTDVSVQVSGPWQTGAAPADGQDYLFRPPGSGGATVYWPFPPSL